MKKKLPHVLCKKTFQNYTCIYNTRESLVSSFSGSNILEHVHCKLSYNVSGNRFTMKKNDSNKYSFYNEQVADLKELRESLVSQNELFFCLQ